MNSSAMMSTDEDEVEEVDMLLDDASSSKSVIRSVPAHFPALITVEPLVLMYVIACLSSVPTFNQYIYERVSRSYNFTPPNDEHRNCTMGENVTGGGVAARVGAESARLMLWATALTVLPSLLVTLPLEHCSNVRGRKIAMLAPLVGGCVGTILCLLEVQYEWSLNVLLVSSFTQSFCGGGIVIGMACYAYLCDVTTEETRSFRIYVMDGLATAGTTAALAMAGYVIKYIGYTCSFAIAGVLCVISILYVVFVLKETVVAGDNATLHKFLPFKVYTKNDGMGRRIQLLTLLALFLLCWLANIKETAVPTYYFFLWPLCFDSASLGTYSAISVIFQLIVCALLVKGIEKMKLDESILNIIGSSFGIGAMVCFMMSKTQAMVYGAAVLDAPDNVIAPIVRAMSSKIVAKEEVGALFAAMALAQQVVAPATGVLYTAIYSHTVTRGVPSAAYLAAAAVYGVTLGVACVLYCNIRNRNQVQYKRNDDEI